MQSLSCILNPRSPSMKNEKGLQDQKVNWSPKSLVNFVAVSDAFSFFFFFKKKSEVTPLAQVLASKVQFTDAGCVWELVSSLYFSILCRVVAVSSTWVQPPNTTASSFLHPSLPPDSTSRNPPRTPFRCKWVTLLKGGGSSRSERNRKVRVAKWFLKQPQPCPHVWDCSGGQSWLGFFQEILQNGLFGQPSISAFLLLPFATWNLPSSVLLSKVI